MKLIQLKENWVIQVPDHFGFWDLAHYRFDPATLALIAIGGGTALSTFSTLEEGKEYAEAGKLEQQRLEAEAAATEQASLHEQKLIQEEAKRTKAAQIANIYAQGGALTGSKLLMVADTARNYEADKLVTARNYGIKIGQLRTAGRVARYQGQMGRRTARMRALAGTASSLGSTYLMYKKWNSEENA